MQMQHQLLFHICMSTYFSSIAPGWLGIACCCGKNAILYPRSWAKQFRTSIGAKWEPINHTFDTDETCER